MKRLLVAVFVVVIVSSACSSRLFPWIYRIDVEQGNVIEYEDFEKLHLGLTEKQVRHLIGSPAMLNTFDKNQWLYFYSLREGKTGEYKRQLITLTFEKGDLVAINVGPVEQGKVQFR